MSNVHPLPVPDTTDSEHRARIEKIARGIADSTFEALSDDDRQAVLDELIEIVRPIPAPRAGEVLDAIVKLLPRRKDWSVQDLKDGVSERGVSADPKEVYNAIGYLKRKGHMRRIGYGRYVVDDGTVIVASDDLGGASAPHEDAYRVDD